MNIFVHDNKTGGEVEKLCEAYDVAILTEEAVQQIEPIDVHEFFLDSIDLLILEITKPSQETQFVLAQALLAETPLLCLYAKNQTPRQLLEYIRKKRAPRKVKTYAYLEHELPMVIDKFIRRFDPRVNAEDDIPSQKFTMRLSPRLDRYIEWNAKRNSESKADSIRRLLTNSMEEDPTYLRE